MSSFNIGHVPIKGFDKFFLSNKHFWCFSADNYEMIIIKKRRKIFYYEAILKLVRLQIPNRRSETCVRKVPYSIVNRFSESEKPLIIIIMMMILLCQSISSSSTTTTIISLCCLSFFVCLCLFTTIHIHTVNHHHHTTHTAYHSPYLCVEMLVQF